MFPVGFLLHFETFCLHWKDKTIWIYFHCITSDIFFFLQHQNVTYVPVFDTKIFIYESVFIIIILIKLFSIHLSFEAGYGDLSPMLTI